jgi:ABC-type branched-subunit amino acid transport system ATPase component/ABC-type branched-subunit amino acid transport system permease subunit
MKQQEIWVAILAFIAVVVIAIVGSSYYIHTFVLIGILFIVVMGLDLLLGYSGQLSLGNNGFFAIGAYFSAVISLKLGISPWIALFIGILANSAIATLVGYSAVRIKGFYLAAVTLAFGIVIYQMAGAFSDLTGGFTGIGNIPRLQIGNFVFDNGFSYSILVWIIALLVFWLSLNIVNSRAGRALRAIRDDETAAEVSGISLRKYKVQVFILSAIWASIAGSLFTHFRSFIMPDNFSMVIGLEMLLMLFLGGAGTVWGCLLGISILKILPEVVGVFAEFKLLVYGLVFVFILFFVPGGLAGWIQRLSKRFSNFGPFRYFKARNQEESTGCRTSSSDYFRERFDNGVTNIRPILEIKGLTKSFGGILAVNNLDFNVPKGQIKSVIGPNGAGKSTLINLLNGVFPANHGEIVFKGEGIAGLKSHKIASLGIARTFQVPRLFEHMNVVENVMVGYHTRTKTEIISAAFLLRRTRNEEAITRERALNLLAFMGMADKATMPASALSVGEKKLLQTARALACEPNLLLLDEPVAGLNDAEKEAFQSLLLKLKGMGMTILLIEHDMNFVMRLSDSIVVMNFGTKIAEGIAYDIQRNDDVIRAYLGEPE